MIYRKVRTNLSRTLSAIEQDKATSDDYVKCILADPQIAAYIVQAVVEEFKDMEIDEIIPCMGEPTVTLKFPERLGVKVRNTGNESVDEEDGKIIYDIKFPVYYKRKKKEFIINIEAQKSSKKSKLGYKLENRITYYMGRMISEQKGTEFSGSSYDDIKSIYSIWICMDTKKTDDSIIEFGMKSNLIYGKIKKIPNENNSLKESTVLLKKLKIKFSIFFLIIFLLVSFFWYFISAFCAVYKNTQMILIENTLSSFGLSLLYPFGINLIPGILRIPSLKNYSGCSSYTYFCSKLIVW